MTKHTAFEVQFKDGFGAWRRWSLNGDQKKAEASHKRLLTRLGTSLVPTRIVER